MELLIGVVLWIRIGDSGGATMAAELQCHLCGRGNPCGPKCLYIRPGNGQGVDSTGQQRRLGGVWLIRLGGVFLIVQATHTNRTGHPDDLVWI